MTAERRDGGIALHVEVRIDVAELAGWKPERIAALFDGIAQVLAARSASQSADPEGA